MEKKIRSIATLGLCGYMPAPGTVGTIITLPLAYMLSFYSALVQAGIIVVLAWSSYYFIAQVLPYFRSADPCQIIIDEMIGCLFTFFLIPYSCKAWIIGFILFRVFDIFKPCGIAQIEKLPGACGILFDDIIAGLFANLILRSLFL